MKQNISTLMDGEMCGDEAEILLGRIKRHPEAQQEWLTYHLIGDAMRQPDYLPADLKSAFFARLHAEPTVLAPHSQSKPRAGSFAMSAVASIMAIAFLVWLSVQIDTGPSLQQAQQRSNALRTASFPVNASLPINDGMNDYLLAHQEFSPSTDVRGAASYIRTVAVKLPVAGQ
jgi:sigma-E factor negative regulatory protein RseA